MATTVNDYNKVQINFTVRKNGKGDVIEQSAMVNVRTDDPAECFRLYENLRQKLNGELEINSVRDEEETKECPECGGSLVERTVKNGAKAGRTFWGCSSFPQCRYTA